MEPYLPNPSRDELTGWVALQVDEWIDDYGGKHVVVRDWGDHLTIAAQAANDEFLSTISISFDEITLGDIEKLDCALQTADWKRQLVANQANKQAAAGTANDDPRCEFCRALGSANWDPLVDGMHAGCRAQLERRLLAEAKADPKNSCVDCGVFCGGNYGYPARCVYCAHRRRGETTPT